MAHGKAKVVWSRGVRSTARPTGGKEVSGMDRSQDPGASYVYRAAPRGDICTPRDTEYFQRQRNC